MVLRNLTCVNNYPIIITKDSKTNKVETIEHADHFIKRDYKLNELDTGVILYPYSKAIAQLILHKIYDYESIEMPYEELKAIPSLRGVGKLGSSNK